MRIFLQTFLLCGLLTACAAPVPSPTPTSIPTPSIVSLTGEWIAGVKNGDSSNQSILFNFDESTLNIEPRTKTWSLTITQETGVIHISATGNASDPFKQIEFTGSFINQVLSGELNWDGKITQVTFIPLAKVDDAILEKYVGVYQFESGRALSIIHNPSFESNGLNFFHDGLAFTDLENGDSRGLYSIDNFTFGIGALRVVGAPLSGRVQFIVDDQGQAMGLMWWDMFDGITPSADSGQYATRVNYSTEALTFTSADGAVMAGLLTSPETPNPHPAFMMLHGSEPGVKDGFGQQILAHYMISQGIALLTYDKRGVGDSEGVYRESPSEGNIKLIASDAVAGTDYLSTRPEIDSAKIGLIGGSQAGWVIPVAVAESDNVDFFVIQSGPVLSFAQEDYYSTITNDGDTATTYDAEKLDQTIREMKPSGVDPIPVLNGITQPGLWLWGSVDKNVPFKVSAENLQALIDSGKDNFSYSIFSHGDHNLNETEHGYFAEIPYAPRVLYFSKLTEWLEQNNIAQRNTSAKTLVAPFEIGSVKISEKDSMMLLYVPGGEFTMGSENGEDNEKPVHRVFLNSFWIDQTEITNSMYALCVDDGGCEPPGSKESLTRPAYYGEIKYKNYPVVFVDWGMANAYCEWAGRRLPTEAEWEKSARGVDAFAYPWGNAIPDKNLLNYNDFIGDTTEVGNYPNGVSPYGALDMGGNVWEWVNDWFAPDYYQNSPASNPLGPSTGRTHVLRGGSWNLSDDLVRSTYRGTHPSEPNLGIGFRCAMDAKE